MNAVPPTRKARGRRSYDNSLRQEQARQTRERIVEAVVERLAAGEEVAFASVARHAGVSEPTVYRNFPNREALLEAVTSHVQERLGLPPMPTEADAVPDAVVALFEAFGRNAPLIHAMLRARTGREVRERGRAARTERIRRLVDAETAHLDAPAQRSVFALFRLLAGWDAWRVLTEEHGLTDRAAGEVAGWAVDVLFEDLRKGRRSGRKGLRGDGRSR